MNLLKLLKAFGIDITPEQVKAAEELLQTAPQKANEFITFVNAAWANIDSRLTAMEAQLNRIEDYNGKRIAADTGSGGIDPTGRAN